MLGLPFLAAHVFTLPFFPLQTRQSNITHSYQLEDSTLSYQAYLPTYENYIL